MLIRIKPIIDTAAGPGFLRTGLLVVGLATLLVAALMLTVTGDVKRMLAYSSMENMGLIAIAAAAGTTLAIAALLLHVLAHGIGKTVLFLAGGQLQAAHGSTAIADITGVVRRSRLIGGVIRRRADRAARAAAVRDVRQRAGHRPVAGRCAAGLGAGRGHAADRRRLRRAGAQLRAACCSAPRPLPRPPIAVPATVAAALLVGVAASPRPRDHRGPAHRPVHHRRKPCRSRPMKPNWLRHRLSRDELAGKAEELLAEGFRLGLVAAHDDGDRLRVVYLFLAGHPDRRVELESLSARSRSGAAVAGVSVLSG